MSGKPIPKNVLFRVYGQMGGRVGGLSTSRAKREAARINGAKGGRPRTKKGNHAN